MTEGLKKVEDFEKTQKIMEEFFAGIEWDEEPKFDGKTTGLGDEEDEE